MSARIIKNVTLVGPSGNLGEPMLKAFMSSRKFNLQILRRKDSKTNYPSSLKVVDVDFDSAESLVEALKGQDAIVSTLGDKGILLQKNIIDAAATAGVYRFIPSEFGSNMENAKTRTLAVFKNKVDVLEYMEEKAKTTSLTWTAVMNGPFLDWGLQHHLILDTSKYSPVLLDEGVQPLNSTALETVTRATVAILEHAKETENRTVRISDIKITQKRLFELAKQALPDKPWTVNYESLDVVRDNALARMKQGIFDLETIVGLLNQAILRKDGGGDYEPVDNELLGVKGKSEDDVVAIFDKIHN